MRDELAEVEVAAGMIQRLLDEEPRLDPARIGLLLDGSPFRDRAIAEVFARAGLPLSGLRRRSVARDLGSEALRLFLLTRRVGAPAMAMASLLSLPLWPWPLDTGADLALAAQDSRARRTREIPPEVSSCRASDLLVLLRDGRAKTPGELVAQLQALINVLPTIEGEATALESAREGAAAVLERVRSLPAGAEIPWEELLRGLSVARPETGEGPEYWREGITVSYEESTPERELDHLFVLGFAEGHYPPAPAISAVFDDNDRLVLRYHEGLFLLLSRDRVDDGRAELFCHVRNVSQRCVLLTPLRDLAGKPRNLSGTMDLMAGMFTGIGSAEQLLRIPERKGDRGCIPGLALAPATEPSAPRTMNVADLELGLDLYVDPAGTIRPDSPTRLEKMLVSPLAWLFDRLGLIPRSWAPEQCDPPTCGTIAHAVFEHLFVPGQELPSPEEVERRVPDLFARAVAGNTPFLLGEEWSVERNRLAGDIVRAATAWAGILK
ncbi:MAG TPA: PD-(D/E)XK nuclease family protein, partial [Candidatus Aminicenantes bacterium]|nr:PD-(D/E)XK nuclease family protein [Candidatus Aminicenantes bacterium]